jgi:hypothetical protein
MDFYFISLITIIFRFKKSIVYFFYNCTWYMKRGLRGTIKTSLFFSRLSPRCPPAQSPIVNLAVALQICYKNIKITLIYYPLNKYIINVYLIITWYSFWYSFILETGFLTDFCLRRCESSDTGNQEFPHTTYSSNVSYTNLYWSWGK